MHMDFLKFKFVTSATLISDTMKKKSVQQNGRPLSSLTCMGNGNLHLANEYNASM